MDNLHELHKLWNINIKWITFVIKRSDGSYNLYVIHVGYHSIDWIKVEFQKILNLKANIIVKIPIELLKPLF